MTNAKVAKVFTPSAQDVAYAQAIVQSLDALSAKRQVWESTDFKKANDGLYALLAECLDTFRSKYVNASKQQCKTLREELVGLLKVAGVKVQKNTSTLTMFVRYVFGSDRKRAHGYSYVLAAAISHEVETVGFADWVRDQGGIEEIKRKMVKSEQAIEKAKRVKATLEEVVREVETALISPIASVPLALSGQFAILLAKPNLDGTTSVVGALPDVSEKLFSLLLERVARQRVKSAESDALIDKEMGDLLGSSVLEQSDLNLKAA